MNDMTTIYNADALTLINNYKDVMESISDSNSPITGWFTDDSISKRKLGFQIGFPDFLTLCSSPGLTKLEVCFGLTTNHADSAKLVLLLKMSNKDSSIASRYHQLTTPLFDYAFFGDQNTSIQYNKVPRIFHEIWTKNWKDTSQIPKKALEIILTEGLSHAEVPINTYTFQLSDIVNTLYPIKMNLSDCIPINTPLMHVYFVSHSNAYHTDNKWAEFDKIGIMFGMTQQDSTDPTNRILISSCYDFSAPCPPTCSA